MSNLLFVLMLAGAMIPVLLWFYRVLPGEQWQFLAAFPVEKGDGMEQPGAWCGSNLTFYGLFLATGSLLGVTTFLLLLSGVGVGVGVSVALIIVVMAAAVGAAKGIARLVEDKPNTFTVAGGASAGLYLMPIVVWVMGGLIPELAGRGGVLVVMAALATAYLLGEGIGRLACISFGCCYGKPVAELSGLAAGIFSRLYATYHGETKKIVYASGLAGVKVVPIQAITSFLFVCVGLGAMYCFLEGRFSVSFGLAAIFSMAWRIVSEYFRADYRGEGRLSAYQKMGMVNIAFCIALLWMLSPADGLAVHLDNALVALWSPEVVLFLQTLWVGLFCYFGCSRVTGATLRFHVRTERV